MHYHETNPAIAEQPPLKERLKAFNTEEQRAFLTMTKNEIKYLREECFIDKYINHLRRGRENKALGEDFPVLIIKGTKLQLERFKMVFLMSLLDYQGIEYYYPSQFSLGEEVLEEIRKFTGVAIIKVVKGAATTEGLDNFRTELIMSAIASRRDYFNPTLILTEESISGKFNVTNDLTRVVVLDGNKLRGSYDGSESSYNDSIVSRAKVVNTYVPKEPTYTAPQETYSESSGRTYSKYKKKEKKLSVNEMAEIKKRGCNG